MPILDWRELQNMVDKKQKGYDVDSSFAGGFEDVDGIPPEQWEQYDADLQNFLNKDKKSRYELQDKAQEEYSQNVRDIIASHDKIGDDYGAYKRDASIPYQDWIQDPLNYRANAQTNTEKVINGLGKMAIYAGATAIDNIAGTVAGVISAMDDLYDGGGFHPGKAFINNPISLAMQDLRDWSEKALPNYRTTEELDDQEHWWKHLNANFWGDVFLKNLGFTIGAAASGWGIGKLGRLAVGKTVNNAYKAGLAASVNGDAAAEKAFQEVIKAAQPARAEVASSVFSKLRPSFRNMNIASQVLGGVGGAVGEARVEALSAAKEFRDEYAANTAADFENAKQKLAEDIANNPRYQGVEYIYDGYGTIIGERPALNASGQEAWLTGLQDLQDKYTATMNTIDAEADRVANKIFWYNMPILSGSNMVMFGRLMSGGYRSQFTKLNKVKGNFGNYTGRGSVAGAVGRGFMNATTEGLEELSQKIVSEGRKSIAESNMAAFHNGKYDTESIRGLSEWLMSMTDTAGNILADNTSWQEFAVGFLTGALGVPTHVGISNWSGGIIGGIQEGLRQRKMNNDAAKALNERINKPEFKDMWQGLVRHNTYERLKDEALDKNDEFRWHEANDSQILSDVMMFSNAGRLNDLEDYVDSFAKISVDDIQDISQDFLDESDPDLNSKSDEEKVEWIKQRANDVKRTIEKYRKYTSTYDGRATGELKNEFIYSRVKMSDLEDRYNSILPEVLDDVTAKLENKASKVGKNGELTAHAKKAQKVLSAIPALNNLFGERSNRYSWNKAQDVSEDEINDAKEALDSIAYLSTKPEIKQKAKDLKKIIDSRQLLYDRLFDPETRAEFIGDFITDAITEEQKAQELNNQAAAEQVDGLNSLNSIKDRYYNTAAEKRAELINNLRAVVNDNPAAKDFMQTYDSYNNFRKYLAEKNPKIVNGTTGEFSKVAEMILDDAFRKSNNEEELIKNLSDNLLSEDAVMNNMQLMVSDGLLDETEAVPPLVDQFYKAAEKAIKERIAEFKNTVSATSGRQEVKTEQKEQKKREQKPTGVDNPEPASESKKPVANPAPIQPVKQEPEQPQQNAQEEVPQEEALNLDEKTVVLDASDSYIDDSPEEKKSLVENRNGDAVLGFYQMSFSEIQLRGNTKEQNVFVRLKALVNQLKVAKDKAEVSKLNEAIGMLTRDFVTFDEKGNPTRNEQFAPTYKWLQDNGAFEYVATKLNVGDKLVFCYMAGCPRYDGVPQVVVGVVKERDADGNITSVQPLTTLHRPNSDAPETRAKYAYLDNLYSAIQSDFDSRGPDGPLFVFGGKKNPITSRVFGIRPGIVPFANNNRDLKEIDSYSDDAPIVMIGTNDEPIVLRGKVSDTSKLFLPTRNNKVNRYGQLYYMVRNGKDSYTPIALARTNLTREVFEGAKEGGFVDSIKKEIAKIDNLVSQINDTNAAELNQKLSPILKSLNSKMVLKDTFFTFENFQLNDGSFANGLRIKWTQDVWEDDGSGNNLVLKHKPMEEFIEDVSSESIYDIVSRMNKPVQISPLQERRSDSIKNLSSAIEDGLINTNAEMLRQKGVNFLYDPWNGQGKFERLVGNTASAEFVEYDAESGMPMTEVNQTPVDNERVELQNTPINLPSTPSERREANAQATLNEAIGKSYKDLQDERYKSYMEKLKDNGITEQDWESSDGNTRQAFLEC